MQATLCRAAAAPCAVTAPRPLSVAIYINDLSGGGVERQTLALARGLRTKGMAVTVVVHQARGQLRDHVPDNIRLVDLGGQRTLQDIPLIARFLRREHPDVLLANVDHNNVAAMLGNQLAGNKTKVVICQHNSMAAEYFSGLRWTYRLIPFAYRLLAPCFSRAVAVSEGIAGELHTIAHIPDRKITLIHNSVIGPDFQIRAEQPVTHPWFNQPERPVFVTAGRLVAMKDHETLLRALAIHHKQWSSRLLVLGSGPLREKLEALAGELDLREAVDFLGFRENPLPYFQRADAFIMSSYSEGFGNVLVEAMGCGTPVISTNCPHGPAEILDHGRYGMLVAPRNACALATAMNSVTQLRREWPSTVLKARAAEFSDAACASNYMRLFQSLVPMHAS